MQIIRKVKSEYFILLVLLIPAVWALFVPGYYGASDDLHIGWLYEMHQTLIARQFPPRYVPDLSYQFGYPLFNFVFPLPFYLGEIFYLFGLSLIASVKAVFLLSVVLSAIAIYKLLRNFTGVWLSIVGALLYVYTPFRSTDIYVRGALGEALAFVFFPLIVHSLIKLSESKKKSWVGWGAISIAGLILTHNIAAYMFIPASLLLLLMFVFTTKEKAGYIKKAAASYLLGFIISMYFWLSAILDSSLMKYDTVFNYIDHFPTVRQLITPYFGYGASVAGPGDGMSFFMGVLNLLLIPVALLVLFKWRKKYESKYFVTATWAIVLIFTSVFLMNHRSTFIWETIPLIKYFQFPWRFLMLTTFATSILVITLEKLKPNKFVKVGLIVFIVIANFTYFRPQDFLGRQDDYYLNRYIPKPEASEEYKQTSEEYLRLPKYTEKRPEYVLPDIYGDNLDVLSTENKNQFDTRYSIEVNKDTTVNFSRYYFPGWEVYINGQKSDIEPGTPYGQISLNLDKGVHTVNVRFSETKRNYLLDLISLTSFFIAGFLVTNKKWKH